MRSEEWQHFKAAAKRVPGTRPWLAWGVLGHNLWLLDRLLADQQKAA